MRSILLLACLTCGWQAPALRGDEASASVAARIDQFTAAHWKQQGIVPAELTTDAEYLRRLSLDLLGRVPTTAEADVFAADPAGDKRARLVSRMVDSPEFVHHFGTVLDEIIQGKQAGDAAFVEYLRRSLAERRPWDAIFREVMLGPWDGDTKAADTFLRKRLRSIDDLTTDTTVAFFGVNISCAKCHDHPLVQDWKQRHYYGMSSFLHRTTEDKNTKKLSEKSSGDVQFVDTKGGRHTAPIMFLTGTVIDPSAPAKASEKLPSADAEKKEIQKRPEKAGAEGAGAKEKKTDPEKPDKVKPDKEKPDKEKKEQGKKKPTASSPFSPREAEALVEVALRERGFFSRAIVNRLWAYFLGRGLVHPADQMHSENPPSISGALEFLGDDLAQHGYDLRRLVAGIAQSRVYQLSSRAPGGGAPQDEQHFAVARLRALSPQQFATSLLLVSGEPVLEGAADAGAQHKRREELDSRARGLTKYLDPPSTDFQSSVGEALYMSNHPAIQELTKPAGQNLVARLLAIKTTPDLMASALRHVHGREARGDELAFLARWFDAQPDRERAARDLVWSLLTSAEFRFNH